MLGKEEIVSPALDELDVYKRQQQLREPLPETLSPAILTEHHLMPLTEALMNIHFPANPELLRKAQYRLKFEELFYVQLNILRYAKDRQRKYRGYVFETVGEIFNLSLIHISR